MDQTTDTADLTETGKYLNCANELSSGSVSDSDSDAEEADNNALLGGIRAGLSTITRTARKALSTCKNEAELDDAAQQIEASSLKLLKLEKSFLKSASIVSDVIDDLASDYEDNENIESCLLHKINYKDQECLSGNTCDNVDSGDASSKVNQEPYIFSVSERNLTSIVHFKEKLSKEFHKRLDTYENTLTKTQLQRDKKFTALLDQIKLGRNDAKLSIQKSSSTTDTTSDDDDDDASSTVSSFLSKIPFTVDEMLKYQYKPYDEDNDMDHSVLPSVDPITKSLIYFPVRNKYCNHVFDRDSISSYISSNKSATCPVHMCRNPRVMQLDHFVSDSILTSHVRRKNNFE